MQPNCEMPSLLVTQQNILLLDDWTDSKTNDACQSSVTMNATIEPAIAIFPASQSLGPEVGSWVLSIYVVDNSFRGAVAYIWISHKFVI